jgi:hypothetical protein
LGCFERRHVGDCTRAQANFLRPHLEQETARVDSIDVRFSAEERNVVSCTDEQGPKVASNGSGSDDRDFHVLSILQVPIASGRMMQQRLRDGPFQRKGSFLRSAPVCPAHGRYS